MLRIIEGQPGSGKTYYAVNYLFSSGYVKFDKLYNTYVLDRDVFLITNIDDLKVHSYNLQSFINDFCFDVEKIKSYLLQNGYKRIVLIIDEAQRYFSTEAMKQYKNQNDVYFFFEYHRHLGCDIFLIVQTLSALSRRIVQLSEYILRARQRTVSMPFTFIYDAIDTVTGDRLFITKLQKKDEIFSLYKSFDVQEVQKPKPVLLKKWVFGLLLLIIPLFFAIYFLNSGFLFHSFYEKKDIQKQKIIEKNRDNVIVASSNNPLPSSPPVLTESKDNDICLFASCEYPKLRRSYIKKDGETISGRVCYDNHCYYLVQSSSSDGAPVGQEDMSVSTGAGGESSLGNGEKKSELIK